MCFSWKAYGTADPLNHQTSELAHTGSHTPIEPKQRSHTQCEKSEYVYLGEFTIAMFVPITAVTVQADRSQQHVDRVCVLTASTRNTFHASSL